MIDKYRKYKIGLQSDSKKTQGLRTGDIVRRQYVDGNRLIHSLMCVLDYGSDTNGDYFIGALLEGAEPQTDELLDFVRVTSLFDLSRSGALYLTGSDEQAPYMDVIDGIGRNFSLSFPDQIITDGVADVKTQYNIKGVTEGLIDAEYIQSLEDNNRIVCLSRLSTAGTAFIGLKQNLDEYVKYPNRVLVSYKIKASSAFTGNFVFGYTDGTKNDGEELVNIPTEWQYKLHSVTIENADRYLRTCSLDFSDIEQGNKVWVADFNIILLSDIANFQDASKVRIGKLDGINDSVFGKLEGYGNYSQKLYASQAAHISGTLTAGDESGFGSTFYAGKIHRNAFINSLDINFTTPVIVSSFYNPVGVGKVYEIGKQSVMFVQSSEWAVKHKGEKFTLSFWACTDKLCDLLLTQNTKSIGHILIEDARWNRYKITFKIGVDTGDLLIGLNGTTSDGSLAQILFTAPQLEFGEYATQYQPTDDVLNYTEEYGAWFNRGGIGGTIQNPLLKFDETGGISSKDGSLVINNDGTGHFAGGKFQWTESEIIFKGIVIKWDDLDHSAQEALKPKSIKIIGADSFVYEEGTCTPSNISLQISASNFKLSEASVQWQYLDLNGSYSNLPNGTSQTIVISPDENYWGGKMTLTIKCVVNINQADCIDTITIKKVKQGEDAYSVSLFTTNGNTFKNGVGTTTIIAYVFKGGVDITDTLTPKDFDWVKTSDNPHTDAIFNSAHIGFGNKLTITSEDIWNMAQFDCKVRIN